MAAGRITWQGVLIRFIIAIILVFATYNPLEFSYFHWLKSYFSEDGEFPVNLPLMVFAGVVLLIGWTIYLRATLRSLGVLGLVLASAFFATLLWLVIDNGIVSTENTDLLTNLVLGILAGVLAVGMSWSHIRRRISGQADVDDVDL